MKTIYKEPKLTQKQIKELRKKYKNKSFSSTELSGTAEQLLKNQEFLEYVNDRMIAEEDLEDA